MIPRRAPALDIGTWTLDISKFRYHDSMPDLPVMLRVDGRRVVIVGGGGVAKRRAAALVEAGADVVVIAPDVTDGIEQPGVTVHQRGYEPGDLDGAMLVVIATNDPVLNDEVARFAEAAGVLTNRADDPEAGDVIVPAHKHVGPLSVAVSTGGVSARAGATIRDAMLASLDPAWVTLLETVAPFRVEIQTNVSDPAKRRAALLRLTDREAMNELKNDGVQALQSHCEKIVEEATTNV